MSHFLIVMGISNCVERGSVREGEAAGGIARMIARELDAAYSTFMISLNFNFRWKPVGSASLDKNEKKYDSNKKLLFAYCNRAHHVQD